MRSEAQSVSSINYRLSNTVNWKPSVSSFVSESPSGTSSLDNISPQCVEYPSIVPDPEHTIGCGDPVGVGLLGVAEEGVRDPDLAHHVAVQTQDLHGTVEL